jgi:hypothetical protein
MNVTAPPPKTPRGIVVDAIKRLDGAKILLN